MPAPASSAHRRLVDQARNDLGPAHALLGHNRATLKSFSMTFAPAGADLAGMGPLLTEKPEDRAITFAQPGDGCWFGSCSADPYVVPGALVALALILALFMRKRLLRRDG